jgi:hypothetical protein
VERKNAPKPPGLAGAARRSHCWSLALPLERRCQGQAHVRPTAGLDPGLVATPPEREQATRQTRMPWLQTVRQRTERTR